MIYIIIGSGGFGLYTALNLRKLDKNAIIKIIDKNKNNSATVNGGNGITSITPIPNNLFNFISFSKYKTPN
jgi:succinate dehydrogenase/fumarate reductase flavoprotein subunit